MSIFKKDPEKERVKEAFKVFNIAESAIKSDLYRAIPQWAEYMKIVSNSQFKDMYQPEDAKKNIKEKIYKSVENCNGQLKEKLDNMLHKENNGIRPLSELVSCLNLDANEVNSYCLNKKSEKLTEDINISAKEMMDSLEAGKYNAMQLFKFDSSVASLENLMKNFNINNFSVKSKDDAIPPEKLAAQYGISWMQVCASKGKPSVIFSDNGLNTYAKVKEITEKYTRNAFSKEADKDIDKHNARMKIITDIHEDFIKKSEKFREWAEKSQDRLYCLAMNKTNELRPIYKKCADKFMEFSWKYSQILGEDNESLTKVMKKFDTTLREAYANATPEKQDAFNMRKK